MSKVVAVIQARMGSTRLPGKVLMPLGADTVLGWVMRACCKTVGVNEAWIATTTESRDDPIAEIFAGRLVFRGSETDVLARFVGVAEASGADILLRITGDEPFIDPRVISEVVALQKRTGAAYVSNVTPRTYPDGLDVECFTREALMAAHKEATRLIDRDCVTTWIARNRSRFPAEAVINPIPGMETERWVLDTADDLAFCRAVAAHWPWSKGPPSQLDILDILDKHPEIRKLNSAGVMNERYFDALADEPLYRRSHDRSQAAFERAHKVIPLAAQTFSKSYLQFPQPSPLFLSHGQGGLVWDIDGNEYVDCVSALLPNILGYRDGDVDAAIRRQLSSGISFSLATELEAQLAETLCRLIPCAEAVRFGKSGTDATTAAIRLARAYTKRDRVLICGGYHGWSDWSVERNLGVPDGVRELSARVRYGNGEQLTRSPFAAAIVEPETDPDYLRFLRQKCDQSGTILIFDEVITGFRLGLGGAQECYGITPDLACFGKAMANGMPLSAVAGRKDIMRLMEPPDNIFYSGTFFGETLSLAAAIATIDKLERQNVLLRIITMGRDLAMQVSALIERYSLANYLSLYGHPSLNRIGFRNDKIAAVFRREMIATGTLIIGSHNLCYAHSHSDIKRIIKSWDWTLGVLKTAIDDGSIETEQAVGPMVRTA